MERDVLELAGSLAYLDELHDQFTEQPEQVEPSWHKLLDAHGRGGGNGNGSHVVAGNGHPTLELGRPVMPTFARPGQVTMSPITAAQTVSVWPLVNAYRTRGHFQANLDPLGLLETARIPELEIGTWGFSE